MKILVNALFLRAGVNGGTETYTRNMTAALNKELPSGCTLHYIVSDTDVVFPELPFKSRMVVSLNSNLTRVVYEQFVLPRLARQYDIVWSPGYVGLVFRRKAQIITIHDAYAWMFRKEIGVKRAFYWRVMTFFVKNYKDVQFISVSKSTTKDLLKHARISSAKLFTIYESSGFKNSEILKENGNYFLAVGIWKGIKNPHRIMEGYSLYRDKVENPLDLYIVGRSNDVQSTLYRDVPGVKILGRVGDKELETLYQSMRALLFPSLYEGFGLPILESFSFGRPVITSKLGATEEIAGNGAYLVNPLKSREISEGLLFYHHLTDYSEMRHLSLKRGRFFSWEKAAIEFVKSFIHVQGI